MNWINLPKDQRRDAIEDIREQARLMGSHPLAAVLTAASDFLSASTEEPFAEQINAEMANLRELYEAWKLAPTEATWQAAFSASVSLHYMLPANHAVRKKFNAFRQMLADSKPSPDEVSGPRPGFQNSEFLTSRAEARRTPTPILGLEVKAESSALSDEMLNFSVAVRRYLVDGTEASRNAAESLKASLDAMLPARHGVQRAAFGVLASRLADRNGAQ